VIGTMTPDLGMTRASAGQQNEKLATGINHGDPEARALYGRLDEMSFGSPTMIFVVLEEIYSIAPDGSERELLSRSPQPLFAGDRQTAQWDAKNRAAEFDAADYHQET
jgi:hypothetical protein